MSLPLRTSLTCFLITMTSAVSLLAGSGGLSIDDAIDMALAGNPTIRAMRHDAAAAEAGRDMARGALAPSVNLRVSTTHFIHDQRVLPANENFEMGAFSDDMLVGGLSVSYPLFTGHRLENEAAAAGLLADASRGRFARSRDELVFEVTRAFWSILAGRQVIKSLELSHRAIEEHLARVKALVAVHKAARVDRLRTEVRLADISHALVAQRNALRVRRCLLASLLGTGRGLKLPGLKGSLETEDTGAVPDEETALAAAYRDRPDIKAAQKELAALKRRFRAARAGYSPFVSLVGSVDERLGLGSDSSLPAHVDESGRTGSIGLSVRLPIFDGKRIRQGQRALREKIEAAAARLTALQLKVRLEVETALSGILSAGERVRTMEKSRSQAIESLRVERHKYELGKGAIVDVLDAQSALLDAQTRYAQALADLKIEKARLRLALGAGDDGREH